MALIKCPECGREISDKASECPQCAFPLISKTISTENKVIVKEEIESKEGCFLQTLNLGCMIIFAIIAVIIIIVLFVVFS